MNVLLGLTTRLALARLFVLLRADTPTDELQRLGRAAADGGADLVGLLPAGVDDKTLAAAYETLAKAVVPAVVLGVADAPDVAQRVKADLLVVGPGGPTPRRPHQWALVGRTVSSERDLKRVLVEDGVDFVLVGRAVDGLDLLARAAELAPSTDPRAKPWFAAGGITPGNLARVQQAGASRIAVSTFVASARDPKAATAELEAALRQAWLADPGLGQRALGAFSLGGSPGLGATPGFVGATNAGSTSDEARKPAPGASEDADWGEFSDDREDY